jgi:hypothetical protein
MPPVWFEPTIPASARPQTYALGRAATGIGYGKYSDVIGSTPEQWYYQAGRRVLLKKRTVIFENMGWIEQNQNVTLAKILNMNLLHKIV